MSKQIYDLWDKVGSGWERGDLFPCTRNRIRFFIQGEYYAGKLKLLSRRSFRNIPVAGPVSMYSFNIAISMSR